MFRSKSGRDHGRSPELRLGEGLFASVGVSEFLPKAADKPATPVALSETKRDQLPPRPSTSAGPGSDFVKRKNAEKRETKDDLYFNPLAAHGKGATTFYNFPLPGGLPTPASSPTKSTVPAMPRKSSMKQPQQRPATPDSMETTPAPLPGPVPVIGMALGSPTHPRSPTIFQQSPIMNGASPERGSLTDEWSHAPLLKRKQSKWRILGGLFGSKKGDASDFYQVKQDINRPATRSAPEPILIEPSSANERPKSLGRSKSFKDKHVKDKPDTQRNDTVPLRFDMSGGVNTVPVPEIHFKSEAAEEKKGLGLLDVDIPVTKLDRYSVMFSSFLQPPPDSSSLLARRQATLEKLKSVNKALASREQELDAHEKQIMPRPMSSPHPGKSPSFSLFPKDQVRSTSPSRARSTAGGLIRSNTSPAALSPARPSFAPGPQNEAHTALLENVHAAIPEDSPASKKARAPLVRPDVWIDSKGVIRRGTPPAGQATSAKSVSEKPPPPPPKLSQRESVGWSPEQSHLRLDSPEPIEHYHERQLSEECEKEDIYDPAPLPMRTAAALAAGQHTANSSVSNSSVSGSAHSTSTSVSSAHTAPSAGSLTSTQLKEIRMRSPSRNPAMPANSSRATALPITTRSRAATSSTPITSNSHPASALPRRKANMITTTNHAHHPQSNSGPRSPEEIQTAADLSIARQISVSQQQRNFLPKATPPTKAPVPARDSPLSAVASAARVEASKASNPHRDGSPSRVHGGSKLPIPRHRGPVAIVQAVKPSTPTLVVVDGARDEGSANLWSGKMDGGGGGGGEQRVSLAERRSQEERLRVGSSGMEGERRDLQHRKSERVVLDRISIASSVGGGSSIGG